MNVMLQYVRNANRTKRGVLVAFKLGDNIYVGSSLCMKTDKFDREEGIDVAVKNALDNFTVTQPKIAASVIDDMEQFKGRVSRYFKDGVKPAWF